MSALIPEALGNTHLEEAVVLHWKFAVAKKDSKPCKGVPVEKIDCLHCSWAQTASDKTVGPCGASHAGRKSVAGENS